MNSLTPEIDNPFFIVTPSFSRNSAGIRSLYLMCHYLNVAGHRAFIVNYPPDIDKENGPAHASFYNEIDFPGGLIAPMITQDVLRFYHGLSKTPIVIYPEIFDNPLEVSFFGRYILNYPGRSAPGIYTKLEAFSVAYSERLASYCTGMFTDRKPTRDVLFIPTMDLGFWNRNGEAPIREGSCFYAGKMRRIHNKDPENVPKGSVEIANSRAFSASHIRRLFWKSRVFYCYEDSALAIEAQLCGCPTIFIPNILFDGQQLASTELGADGSCILGTVNGFELASSTVRRVENNIRKLMLSVPQQVAELGTKWKKIAAESAYQGTINYPYFPKIAFVPKTYNNDLVSPQITTTKISLDHDTIRIIAHEILWEQNRKSFGYKMSKLVGRWISSSLNNKKHQLERVVPATPNISFYHGNITETMNDKRIVIFAHYDPDGLIDAHVMLYLHSLRRICGRILFISDCELRDGEVGRLNGVAEPISIGQHGEYDFGSWKRGFIALNFDLSDWEEVVIANDSCYAPLFSLETTFRLAGHCDFWGATKEAASRVTSDFAADHAERAFDRQVGQTSIYHGAPDFEFVNSYFMVFRKAVITDPHFIDFWKGVSRQKNKYFVIEMYEIELTRLLTKLGYSYKCLANRNKVVEYDSYNVPVPKDFRLPWLRVLICKENKEEIPNLDAVLNKINYPRFLIDAHVERIIGTSRPSHYFMEGR